MDGHANVISSNLLNLYTPVEAVEEVIDMEEDVGKEPADPKTKLPKWSLTPDKIGQRWPAYTAQKKETRKNKQGEDSFAGAEDLEVSAPDWLLAKDAAEAESEEESSDSDSPEESDEEEKRGGGGDFEVK